MPVIDKNDDDKVIVHVVYIIDLGSMNKNYDNNYDFITIDLDSLDR